MNLPYPKSLYPNFDWPEEGWKEEDFTLDFIYDLHTLVAMNGPNEFANMLVFHDLDLYKVFCDRWMEYNETEYWKTRK
jgi:hypothetical protein